MYSPETTLLWATLFKILTTCTSTAES